MPIFDVFLCLKEMKGSRTDLRGKRVVFTGKLSNSTRNQAEARARVFGCIVVGSISKKTDVVVIGEDAGSKEDKAKELGGFACPWKSD